MVVERWVVECRRANAGKDSAPGWVKLDTFKDSAEANRAVSKQRAENPHNQYRVQYRVYTS